MDNECMKCGITLTESNCCCGDIDNNTGNYVNALCVECCVPITVDIWDGKSTGGGYYIVTAN